MMQLTFEWQNLVLFFFLKKGMTAHVLLVLTLGRLKQADCCEFKVSPFGLGI